MLIESDAGVGSGFSDADYAAAGATLTPDVDELWRSAELIVKGMEGIKTAMPMIVEMMGYPADVLRKFVTRDPVYAVRQIIREIAQNAPVDSELLLDFMSPLGIGRAWVPDIDEMATAPFNWGAHNGLEIARIHPRLELLAQYSVSEAYGWAAPWAEMFWSPFTGGPLYGLAHLRVSDI